MVFAMAVKWTGVPPLLTMIACCVTVPPMAACVKAILMGLTITIGGPVMVRVTVTATGLLLAPEVMVTAPL